MDNIELTKVSFCLAIFSGAHVVLRVVYYYCRGALQYKQ